MLEFNCVKCPYKIPECITDQECNYPVNEVLREERKKSKASRKEKQSSAPEYHVLLKGFNSYYGRIAL